LHQIGVFGAVVVKIAQHRNRAEALLAEEELGGEIGFSHFEYDARAPLPGKLGPACLPAECRPAAVDVRPPRASRAGHARMCGESPPVDARLVLADFGRRDREQRSLLSPSERREVAPVANAQSSAHLPPFGLH
jgi:hypothetical protein